MKTHYSPLLLHHVVLTTGYHNTHRLESLSPDLVDACRKLLPSGGHVPFVKGPYLVEIDGPTFGIYRKDSPLVYGGIGQGSDQTWDDLLQLMEQFKYIVRAEPHRGNWLAVIPLPDIFLIKKKKIEWMFDFQRHLAAAMLSSKDNSLFE